MWFIVGTSTFSELSSEKATSWFSCPPLAWRQKVPECLKLLCCWRTQSISDTGQETMDGWPDHDVHNWISFVGLSEELWVLKLQMINQLRKFECISGTEPEHSWISFPLPVSCLIALFFFHSVLSPDSETTPFPSLYLWVKYVAPKIHIHSLKKNLLVGQEQQTFSFFFFFFLPAWHFLLLLRKLVCLVM